MAETNALATKVARQALRNGFMELMRFISFTPDRWLAARGLG
jgi:hypothetical protein